MGSAALMTTNPPIVGQFNDGLPFCSLTGKASLQLGMISAEVSRARNELLFLEGEASENIFILCSGRVKISISSREGKTAILRIAGPGEILGLSAAMSGTPHEASAEAIELCRIKAIPVSEFLLFLQNHPVAAAEITGHLLREYRVVFNNVCRLALPSTIAGRLASLFLDWAKMHSSPEHEHRFILAVTHEEIASMTNTSRETVSRILHQFQHDKLISIKGAALTILEPESLKALVV
jgi:CRP/FNR family transcriptional regulator, cyclic AMP receptor protein